MKKILLAFSLSILLAAGCSKSQQDSGTNTVSQPTPTPPNQTINTNQPSGWKTYSNFKYGYEIKYPQEFIIDFTNAADVNFRKNTATLFSIQIIDNSAHSDAKGIQTEIEINNQQGEGYPYQTSFVEVAGIQSFKQGRYDDGTQEYYYIPTANQTYLLYFKFDVGTGVQTNNDQDKQLIQQILTTFQLTVSGQNQPTTSANKNTALSISTNSNLHANKNKPFQATFQAIGGKSPYAWDGELTAFLYADSTENRVSFMNFKKVDCDGLPAKNMQCYQIYGTPPSNLGTKTFPFQLNLKDSDGSTVSKNFILTVD